MKAQIVQDLSGYPWSSYHEYIKCAKTVDADYMLSMLHADRGKAIDAFTKLMHETNRDECLEIEDKHWMSDDEAKIMIHKVCGISSVSDFQRLDVQTRNFALRQLRDGGLSIRQIERLIGMNRGIIQRA